MDVLTMQQKSDNQKLFVDSDQAKNYAAFRPTYPSAVFETISSYCQGNSTSRDLALDVGCGSGQSSRPLTRYFSRVMGVDVSPTQISHAPSDVPGLTFHVSTAEDMSIVEDSSVDLVTIGAALHWIQLDRFYSEVDRVLKPGGSVVAYSYTTRITVENQQVHDYYEQIYRDIFVPHWSSDVLLCDNKYTDIPSPYGQWLRKNDLVIELSYTVDQLIGLFKSYACVQTYMKQNPQSNLLGEIQEKLYMMPTQKGISKEERAYKLTWPIYMIMTHKPHNNKV